MRVEPREAFIGCLDAAVGAINADFVEAELQLHAAVYNVYSGHESVEKRVSSCVIFVMDLRFVKILQVFWPNESKLDAISTPIHLQQQSCLPHDEIACSISAAARTFCTQHLTRPAPDVLDMHTVQANSVLPRLQRPLLTASPSSLSYIRSDATGEITSRYSLLLETVLDWISFSNTTFLAIHHVEHPRFAHSRIVNLLLEISQSSADQGLVLQHFDFNPSDSRSNSVEAMLSTFLKKYLLDIWDFFPACHLQFGHRLVGLTGDDLFDIYLNAILSTTHRTVVWLLSGLDDTVQSYSWFLKKLNRIATDCDFPFHVIFLCSDLSMPDINPELVTNVSLPTISTAVKQEEDIAIPDKEVSSQQSLVSLAKEESLPDLQDPKLEQNAEGKDSVFMEDSAESDLVRVIQQNKNICHSSVLCSDLVNLFRVPGISPEHRKMLAIWLSNLYEVAKPEILTAEFLNSLTNSVEETFAIIVETAISSQWDQASAIETIQLLTLSLRPLTYHELGDLERSSRQWKTNYTQRPTSVDSIELWLPGIIVIKDNEVHFSHPDFRRFILLNNIPSLNLGGNEQTMIHGRIAELCLEYMTSSHGQDLLKAVPTDGENFSVIDSRRDFLSYAAVYWLNHAQFAGNSFTTQNTLLERFLSDQTMLDAWARVYWIRNSSYRPPCGRLSPLAIFAAHGLDDIMVNLVNRYNDSEWLVHQFPEAIMTATKNALTRTARLLLSYQPLPSEQLDSILQVSVQYGNPGMTDLILSNVPADLEQGKTLHASMLQGLAMGRKEIVTMILSRFSWETADPEHLRELFISAATGGNIDIMVDVLQRFKEEEIEEATINSAIQACRVGQSTVARYLIDTLLKKKEEEVDVKVEPGGEQEHATSSAIPVRDTLLPSGSPNKVPVRESRAESSEDSAERVERPREHDSSGTYLAQRALSIAVKYGQYGVMQCLLEVLNQHNMLTSVVEAVLHLSLNRPRCFKALSRALGREEPVGKSGVLSDSDRLLSQALSKSNSSLVLESNSNGIKLEDGTSRALLLEALEMSNPCVEVVELLIRERTKTRTEEELKEELTRFLANTALYSSYNSRNIVRLLIQAGADVNKKSFHDSWTPVYQAAYSGNTGMLKILLEAKADLRIGADAHGGWLPSHAGTDKIEILRLLISAGARVDERLANGWSPLYLATYWGKEECVEEILKIRPKVELNYKVRDTTILKTAADGGHELIACMLLDAGLDPCHPETKTANATILHVCVTKKQHKLLHKLLLHNIDLESRDKGGRTAINCLSSAEDIPALRLLITRGAKVATEDDSGFTPLHKAIYADEVDLAKLLITQGAPANKPFSTGGTPLHLACTMGSLRMVKMLVEMKADVTHVDPGIQGTVFQAACQNNSAAQSEILTYLLDEKLVDVRQTSIWWGSNLGTACLMANTGIIKRLIDLGADTNAEDPVGRRPIHFALYRTLEHVMCLLGGENKAELMVNDIMQRNPLHFAVISGRVDVVQYVLDQNPSLAKEKDCDDWTPLFWAVRDCSCWGTQSENRAGIIKLLKEAGADIMDRGKGLDRVWTPFKLARYNGLPAHIVALVKPNKKQIQKSTQRTFWIESLREPAQVGRKVPVPAFCAICLLVSLHTC